MKKFLISIIVPVYNSSAHIKRCIKSLLEQTYTNIEIILVDDGSTDNSLDICRSYEKYDKRIKVIHTKNDGVSSARNCGLSIATGEYIGFVDSDDFIEENMYEILLKDIISTKSDISICNIFYETNDGKEIYKCFSEKMSFTRNEFPYNIYNNLSINGYVCNKLYSRKVIFKDNWFIKFDKEIRVLEDNLFNYEIFDNNKSFVCSYINQKLYHYIQIESSTCNKKYDLKKLELFIVREKEISILEKNGYDSDFLKMDYVINFCKATILIKKFSLVKNQLYEKIYNKNRQYIKIISIKNKPLRLKLKYLIAIYLPFIYKIKIYIKKQNM